MKLIFAFLDVSLTMGLSPRHVILLHSVKFWRNQAIHGGVMTSYLFLWWRPWRQKSISGFRFSDGTCLGKWIAICIPNYDETSQCTAEIKLLPVSENERPPYCNCTSGFHFDLCIVIGVSFCIRLPNVVAIRRLAAEIWRHIDFSRWRP